MTTRKIHRYTTAFYPRTSTFAVEPWCTQAGDVLMTENPAEVTCQKCRWLQEDEDRRIAETAGTGAND